MSIANDKKRKELKQEYKRNKRPMGVFLIRNVTNEKVFLGVGHDLEGCVNRNKFQLLAGIHPNKRLQVDWNELGSQSFAFEIVDQLLPADDSGIDNDAELAFLEKLWLEKLQPFDECGYNERKLTREEMLRSIRSKRSSD